MNNFIIICGPQGSGKTLLAEKIKEIINSEFEIKEECDCSDLSKLEAGCIYTTHPDLEDDKC